MTAIYIAVQLAPLLLRLTISPPLPIIPGQRQVHSFDASNGAYQGEALACVGTFQGRSLVLDRADAAAKPEIACNTAAIIAGLSTYVEAGVVSHAITPWGLAFAAGDMFVTSHSPPGIARFVRARTAKKDGDAGAGEAVGRARATNSLFGIGGGQLQPRFGFCAWFELPGREGQQPNSITAA
jgi:hypothetical protein